MDKNNDVITNVADIIIKALVKFYKYAIDYCEECDFENTNMVKTNAKSQGLMAYEMH